MSVSDPPVAVNVGRPKPAKSGGSLPSTAVEELDANVTLRTAATANVAPIPIPSACANASN